MKIISALFINIFLSWFITKLIITPFKKLIPDYPNKRSSHKKMKPRGGGLAFISSNIFTATFLGQNKYLILLPLTFISFLDDYLNVSRWVRFITQISTCFFFVLHL